MNPFPAPESTHPPTRPGDFSNPHSLANKLGRLAWKWVCFFLFRPSPPRLMRRWRNMLLRIFGAKIGKAYIHPSVRIWAPWKLRVGSDVYIDERCNLYNTFGLIIGDRVVISQGVFLCTATHDYNDPAFPLTGGNITVGDDCWIAAEAFIAPSVNVANGTVVGSRSVVTKNTEAWSVTAGVPAHHIRTRVLTAPAASSA